MSDYCPYCPIDDPAVEIIFDHELVLYMQAEKYQGALKYSGVIIPKAHRETVFDMTSQEISATFELLAEVRRWLESTYSPGGYTIGWNCYPIGGSGGHACAPACNTQVRYRADGG